MPTYREPIRIVVIPDVHGMSLRSQSETRFKIMFTVAPGCDFKKPIRDKVQNLKPSSDIKVRFSMAEARSPSLWVFLSLCVRASGNRIINLTN